MAVRRLLVGERVLISRDESGENHVEATVWDYYELLIGEEKRPMVVVDFDDGERSWFTAAEPNVIAIEPDDEADDDDDEDDDDEDEDEDAVGDEAGSADEDANDDAADDDAPAGEGSFDT